PDDLVLDRLLHVAERVEVLDLDLRAQGRGPGRPYRHVGVAAQAALFEVAVVGADRGQHVAQAAEEVGGDRRGADVRLGDDLDQRRAGTIEGEARSRRRFRGVV